MPKSANETDLPTYRIVQDTKGKEVCLAYHRRGFPTPGIFHPALSVRSLF